MFSTSIIAIIILCHLFPGRTTLQKSSRSVPPAPCIYVYALEIGTDSLFTNPFVSIPLNDTTFTAPQDIGSGKYYLHVGCNYDDRSPFVFSDWHSMVVK